MEAEENVSDRYPPESMNYDSRRRVKDYALDIRGIPKVPLAQVKKNFINAAAIGVTKIKIHELSKSGIMCAY